MSSKRRVVITGMGIISSVGIGRDIFWEAIIKGKSGISSITSIDTSAYRCHYGGGSQEFQP